MTQRSNQHDADTTTPSVARTAAAGSARIDAFIANAVLTVLVLVVVVLITTPSGAG